jgi:hypothetical protein
MRARQVAFKGDTEMLVASRFAIRDEFLRNSAVKDPAEGEFGSALAIFRS